jgi:glucose-1-phosphate cytidylyltransferase
LAEETETKPKPMVEVGGRPVLWHIMKMYSAYGFNNFVLCLGYKGQIIRDFFLNYDMYTHDIRLGTGAKKSLEVLGVGPEAEDWTITLADTGPLTMTGGRVKRVEKYIKSDHFMLTYGDGVSDINIDQLLQSHLKSGKIGTVTGVHPPSRFGEMHIEGSQVVAFAEKPEPGRGAGVSGFINGGFFVFRKEFFRYLSDDESCILERKPLESLSRDGQLQVYRHETFWQCMDTLRDVQYLRRLWEDQKAPWKTW